MVVSERTTKAGLVEAIRQNFEYSRCFVIFGTSCDKDIAGMAVEILYLTDTVVVTRSSHPRSAPVESLVEGFAGYGIKVDVASSVRDAILQILAYAGKDDLLLVTGSIF